MVGRLVGTGTQSGRRAHRGAETEIKKRKETTIEAKTYEEKETNRQRDRDRQTETQ